MTALYAIAGNPVFHSKSPLIFNTAFRELAIEAIYLRLAASTPEEIIAVAREMGLQGANITTPFKTVIMRHLDAIEPDAEKVGAVNTIVKRPEGFIGCNTDIAGALGAAESIGFEPLGQKVVILGAGGAARAAAFAFARAGSRVVIANRTFEKARDAAARLGCDAAGLPDIADALRDARLLVSAISSSGRAVDPSLLRPDLAVLDALYTRPGALVRDATERGCTVIDGREWLLAQAAPAFTLFTGQPAPLPQMRKALWKKRLDARKNIALIGFMASGKSIVGALTAARGGLDFIDIDKQIEEKAGASVAEIFAARGEEAFRRMEQEEIDSLRLVSHHVAACGGGSLTVRANLRVLRNNCLSVWLWANLSTVLERTDRDRKRSLLAGLDADASRDLLRTLLPAYAVAADLVIDTEGKRPEEIAERIWDEMHQAFAH